MPAEANIEDLLDPAVYESLVRESCSKELAGKTLSLNPAIPRIAKLLEVAFRDLGIQFYKTRPARLLLTKMGSEPATIMTGNASPLFEKLFSVINERLAQHAARKAAPFT